jgi:hypothetical protein
MKQLFYLLTSAIILLASCNAKEDNKAAGPTIASADMNIILLQHKVIDYSNWKFIYVSRDSIRRSFGISHYLAGRGLEDTSNAVVIDIVTDIPKAKEFYASAEKKLAWERAGVIGEPTYDFVHIIRDDTNSIEIKDRLLIKHKVKDFDAWVKVFDKEGMDNRKAFGLIDRGLGRGAEDPNMVYIIFAVSDWKKVNDRINSEEMKKLMGEAGVEGAPVMVKYTIVL